MLLTNNANLYTSVGVALIFKLNLCFVNFNNTLIKIQAHRYLHTHLELRLSFSIKCEWAFLCVCVHYGRDFLWIPHVKYNNQ